MEPLLEGLEKTSYHERNTRVKVFGHGFKKSDILNEALNQARVEETGLRIPKLLEVRKVDRASGQSSLNSSRARPCSP